MKERGLSNAWGPLGLKQDLHGAPGDTHNLLCRILGPVEELKEVLKLARVLVLGVALGAACSLRDPAVLRVVTSKHVLVLG